MISELLVYGGIDSFPFIIIPKKKVTPYSLQVNSHSHHVLFLPAMKSFFILVGLKSLKVVLKTLMHF